MLDAINKNSLALFFPNTFTLTLFELKGVTEALLKTNKDLNQARESALPTSTEDSDLVIVQTEFLSESSHQEEKLFPDPLPSHPLLVFFK